ncbi:MAG: hypothetical protein NUV88_01255 [Candidatus Kaiserbacteria bacterium]|nr:hypothetical protein [Candidatus Kaiserbacteria bacterium]
MVTYIADFLYGSTKYPCALFKPLVFLGYFGSEPHHRHQKIFFKTLRAIGFRRTFWQLVFPGQTAGLIKRIPVTDTGVNEYHVRFYDDGLIECELEVDRWSSKHWRGPRHHGEDGKKFLTQILELEFKEILKEEKVRISELFGAKNFTLECIRRT